MSKPFPPENFERDPNLPLDYIPPENIGDEEIAKLTAPPPEPEISEEELAAIEAENKPPLDSPKPGWLIWVYLIPVYLIVAYPLAKWIKDTNSGNVKMTREQESAFESDIDIDSLITRNIPRDQLQVYNSDIAKASSRNKKYEIIGRTKGLLLNLAKSNSSTPERIKSTFDNETVINAYIGREGVKPILNDAANLERFFSNPKNTREIFDDVTVTSMLQDRNFVKVFASTKMVEAVLAEPALQALLSNPSKIRDILIKNPNLLRVYKYNAVQDAIKANPQTSNIPSQIGF
jgi:hypothetical protein